VAKFEKQKSRQRRGTGGIWRTEFSPTKHTKYTKVGIGETIPNQTDFLSSVSW
jgi:hypothetical protein